MTSLPLAVLAHGSRDRRSVDSTIALVDRIRDRRPGLPVEAAFLDHAAPRLDAVVGRFAAAGHPAVAVVPLLLSDAFHATVDVPAAVQAAVARHPGTNVGLAPPLGPDPALLDVVDRRLAPVAPEVDGLVLVAAGSSAPGAYEAAAALAAAWGARAGLPALAAFASSATPTVGEAVRRLRAGGAGRVGVGLLLLAPGVLPDRAVAAAVAAGAAVVGEPLGTDDVVVRLVLDRYAVLTREAVAS